MQQEKQGDSGVPRGNDFAERSECLQVIEAATQDAQSEDYDTV